MVAVLGKRLRFAKAFKSRHFALLWVGQTISNLGDGIFDIALAWQVLLMTHSATAMGLLLIASMIPRLAFALIGGVTADRLPRRMIILWSDGGRGFIVLTITILGLSGYLQFWHLVIEALLFGVVDGFFNPAIRAIIPDLVNKEDLGTANALSSASKTIAQLFGPMLGAGLVAAVTPTGAFICNALSFFISVGFLLTVSIPEQHVARSATHQIKPAEHRALERDKHAFKLHKIVLVPMTTSIKIADEKLAHKLKKPQGIKGVISDIQEGLVYVRKIRWIWAMILNAAINNIGFMAALAVAMPKLIADVYGQGATLLGIISSAEALGALLALPLIGPATRMKKRGLLSYLALSLSCIGLIVFGLPFPRSAAPFIAPLASMLVGFGLTFMNTSWFTILHETIPGDKLGRVLSLDVLASFATMPLGEALGGIMADRIGPAMVFVLFGILNLVNVLSLLLVRDVRELE